jgi:predicted lipoprotein with Yx(FWY)xxD motif
MTAAASLVAVSADLTAAQAVPAAAKKAVVVRVVSRHHFGRMLATPAGRSLYVLPAGSCSGSCLAAWPPLLMPKGEGRRIPAGTRCLGKAAFGHRVQVTYRGKRLYLFAGDTGTSVTGNGIMGFKVAKVVRRACPR